jgi:tetratricopeptide (TPR) repeat protein
MSCATTAAGVLVAVMLLPSGTAAQEHAHTAATPERLGTVQFATSCAAEVAPDFNRAMALLHSFEFGASIRAFTDVAARDTTCAMAHWGLALSHWGNPMAPGLRAPALLQRGRAAAQTATRLGSGASDRERLFIAAVGQLFADFENRGQPERVDAYEKAMRDVVARQPEDTEAKIFHALALAASAPLSDKTYARQLEAGAILESLLASQPEHPGIAHYIIHSYDYPALAGRAAAAARRYAEIAPSAAHALHMPSHTFTRVGMWNESIRTNLRSMSVAKRDRSWAEVLHAADYAVYAYLQVRNDSAAQAILVELPAVAAQFDPNAVTGAAPGFAGLFALAAIPARYALERDAWGDAAELQPKATAFPYTEALTYFARALGAAHTGDVARIRESIDSLGAFSERLAAKGEPYWSDQVAIQRLGAQAWLDHAEGRIDEAVRRMREAADREDATEKSAVTPGPLAPARELLGDMLLLLNRPTEALAEYRKALEREPNRYRSLEGARKAAVAAGDSGAAAGYAQQLAALTASRSQ